MAVSLGSTNSKCSLPRCSFSLREKNSHLPSHLVLPPSPLFPTLFDRKSNAKHLLPSFPRALRPDFSFLPSFALPFFLFLQADTEPQVATTTATLPNPRRDPNGFSSVSPSSFSSSSPPFWEEFLVLEPPTRTTTSPLDRRTEPLPLLLELERLRLPRRLPMLDLPLLLQLLSTEESPGSP